MFDASPFDDPPSNDAFGAPPPSSASASQSPPLSLGPFSSGAGYAPAAMNSSSSGSFHDAMASFGAAPPPTQAPSAAGIGAGIRPPNWVPDEEVLVCMSRNCETKFSFWQRRHHCRLCGNVYCDACTQMRAMMPDVFGTKDPQRVCEPCYQRIEPLQESLAEANANALRDNAVDDGSFARYFNSPTRFTLGGEIRKAAYTLQNLIDGMETALDDGNITSDLFRDCDAIMFITVCKLAFLGGVRFGTGLVVSRSKRDPTKWSAPCAVILLGLTFGAQIGGSLTDLIVPMHDKNAVKHFSVPGGSHVMLGGEAGLALGPIGRSGEASIGASMRGVDTAVSYSHSRGLYSGITVDGGLVKVRDDVNLKFYGKTVNPAHLFNGQIDPPPAANPLYEKLAQYESKARGGEGQVPSRSDNSYGGTEQSSSFGGGFGGSVGSGGGGGGSDSGNGGWSLSTSEATSMYQNSTPEQRQAALNAGTTLYNSTTPEQRRAFAESVTDAAANNDSSVFI